MEATANFSLSVYSILIKNKKNKTQKFFYCNLRVLSLSLKEKKKKRTWEYFFFPSVEFVGTK